MRKRTILYGVALAFITGPALSKPIDLTKVWGDRNGCINKDGQEEAFDSMLLIKEGVLVTAASACTINDATANADGSTTIKTSCDSEDGESEATFRLVPAEQKKGAYAVIAEDDFRMGEVSLCGK